MIRNIIFDMGHVLMWYLPQEACRALLQNEQGQKALYDAFFGGQAWVEVDHGRLDGEAFTDTVKALLPARLHAAVDAAVPKACPKTSWSLVGGMDAVVDYALNRGFNVYLFVQRRKVHESAGM